MQSLASLNVSSTKIERFPAEFAMFTCLVSLTVQNCGLVCLSHLPATVRDLDASNNRISVVESVPVSLTKIRLSNNPIRELSDKSCLEDNCK